MKQGSMTREERDERREKRSDARRGYEVRPTFKKDTEYARRLAAGFRMLGGSNR